MLLLFITNKFKDIGDANKLKMSKFWHLCSDGSGWDQISNTYLLITTLEIKWMDQWNCV